MEMHSYRKVAASEEDEEGLPFETRKPPRKSWRPTNRALFIGIGCLVLVLLAMAAQSYHPFPTTHHKPKLLPAGTKLRILPVGDSITEGYRSSDMNGYRLHLLNNLLQDSAEVEFIGSQASGNMSNPQHCGWGGWTINQIKEGVAAYTYEKGHPNVILLHAGTNDLNADHSATGEPWETAPDRLKNLINHLLTANSEAVIILARLTQALSPLSAMKIGVYNKEVAKWEGYEERVVVVDMSEIGKEEETSFDGLHPNDEGYEMMADVWVEGIRRAGERGWIVELGEVDGS